MMMIILLIFVVVLAFALMGILFYLLRKESKHTTEEQAVPILNFQQYKKEVGETLLPAQQPQVSSIKDTQSIPVTEAKPLVEDELDAAKKQLAELEKGKEISEEIKDDDLPRSTLLESNQNRIRIAELEEELRALSEKSSVQAQEALEAINALQKENEELKRILAEKPDTPDDGLIQAKSLIASLQEKNHQAMEELSAKQSSLKDLEDQVVQIQKEFQVQLGEAATTIERLKTEQTSIVESNKNMLTKEKGKWDELNQEWRIKVQAFEASIQTLKSENSQLLSQQQQLQYLIEQAEEQQNDRIKEKEAAMDSLKAANSGLQAANEDLRKDISKLKEFNNHLIEKANQLQYALTKSRAHVAGLEKIYEDLRSQVEQKSSPV